MVWLGNHAVDHDVGAGHEARRLFAGQINRRTGQLAWVAETLIGVWPKIDFARSLGVPSSLKSNFLFCSAGKNPGVMLFTRTPFVAHSRARNRVALSTAALEAE